MVSGKRVVDSNSDNPAVVGCNPDNPVAVDLGNLAADSSDSFAGD